MDDIKLRVKRMWEYLNENGIYTEKELDEAIKNMKPLNIGIFVSPIKITSDINVGLNE
ncbi:hypothetical protein [Clostridium botulinum]|uniref:hypothetical protein n=1 Tax=Clostridium botulinum TaxID=1491 RepID=UPI000174E463|nr:hypothetical protein [Clostridium botulinum]ACD53026.1 ribosomal protein L5 [Clostridium botulinum E3 str. Alaska E43]MBY6949110.1 hypothetical protein [Clostridium botulinum]MBY7022770.1 hypothetical protein [Clostridium botulinum]MCR1159480.1 hypothetical protein [Clostridium botulinum]